MTDPGQTLSLLGLFVSSFAAATVLPFSSEAVLGVVVARSGGWAVPVVVATIGNTLGACTTYWLGRRAATALAPHPSRRYERAASLLRTYGAPAMLLSWVPLLGDALVALAGAARMPVVGFTIWTTAGKLARYAALGMAVAHW